MSPQCGNNTIQTLNLWHLWRRSWYPDVTSMRVKHNTNFETMTSVAPIVVLWCRLNACKTQYTCWICEICGANHGIWMSPQCVQNTIQTLKLWYLWHQSWYSDAASMRVKHNTNVDFVTSVAPTTVSECRPNAYKTQYKRWSYDICGTNRVLNTMQTLNLWHLWRQPRYPNVASMRVNTQYKRSSYDIRGTNHATLIPPQCV
jgi:hypothetical protein